MKEDSINLTLPIPISVNQAYAGNWKRYKSKAYKTWIALAELEMRKQVKYTLSWNEWLKIDLNFFIPLYYKNGNRKKQDIDNFLKPLLDFLGDNISWFDDMNIKVLNAEKIDSKNNEVKILIREI
jgi:Holliday junction resolvase RusA-like endonuclease